MLPVLKQFERLAIHDTPHPRSNIPILPPILPRNNNDAEEMVRQEEASERVLNVFLIRSIFAYLKRLVSRDPIPIIKNYVGDLHPHRLDLSGLTLTAHTIHS